jgi:uncharacterized protein YycO
MKPMDINRDRRRIVAAIGTAAMLGPFSAYSKKNEQNSLALPRPNPINFRSGDLVWPKKPGTHVLYSSGLSKKRADDQAVWLQERNNYLNLIDKAANVSSEDKERAEILRKMEYSDFLKSYAGDQTTDSVVPYSVGSLYVGHVGIIDIDETGTPHVIEALFGKGVVKQKYADWLKGRSNEWVWHGRIHGITESKGVEISSEAKKHIGVQYDFWNFDLDDARGFYCSKLVWLSVKRSQGFAVDGKEESKRLLWFSPKQLLYTAKIDRLHSPGRYGSA